MPSTVTTTFVGAEADIAQLDRLLDAPMIGMDSEWRPSVKPFGTERVAILQLASATDAFIIDLIALG